MYKRQSLVCLFISVPQLVVATGALATTIKQQSIVKPLKDTETLPERMSLCRRASDFNQLVIPKRPHFPNLSDVTALKPS